MSKRYINGRMVEVIDHNTQAVLATLHRAAGATEQLRTAIEVVTDAPTDTEYTVNFRTEVAPLHHRSLVDSELVEQEQEEDV